MSKTGEIEVLARGVYVCSAHLLVCRSAGAGNTFLPGGHVEFKERTQTALVREIGEELGKKASVQGFLGVVEHTFVQKGKRHCELNLVFRMEISGLVPDQSPDSLEWQLSFEWQPLAALQESDLEPAPLRQLLPLWLDASACSDHWSSTY